MGDKMEDKLDQQAQNQLALLDKLERLEEFRTWRSLVVDENIKLLEKQLSGPDADTMPEVALRANIKLLNSLKYYFYEVFEQVRAQRKDTNG